MFKTSNVIFILVVTLFACWVTTPPPAINAEERLVYSGSIQIDEAYKSGFDIFSSKTGIKVNAYTTSSTAAVYRVMNGLCDLAGTTRELNFDQKDMGYVQIIFCKDPLAVIVNPKNSVHDIFEEQLSDIFTGNITNWKEVGGPDHPIIVIVPDKNSGPYRGFDYEVMRGKNIEYDIMTKKATMVIDAVKNFPWGISFVSQGGSVDDEGLQVIKINGLKPTNKCYPYYQTFSFVTSGKPSGAAKAFIDFVFSDTGKEIIKNRGMVPISNEDYFKTLKTCSDIGLDN